MPKMKTHKASKGRVRLTKNGKILRRQCGVRHLLTHRSPKRKRNLRGPTTTETKGYVKKLRIAHQIKAARK
ncbi:MAG: 50S ribosomal protein L35 [Planctomycetota bacterium]